EVLPQALMEAATYNLLLNDGIGPPAYLDLLPGYLTHYPHCKSRTWEGLPPDHLLWKSKFKSYLPDLILVELPYGLHNLKDQSMGEGYVVVRLYLTLPLNPVRGYGALDKVLCPYLLGDPLKDLYEHPPDYLTLLLGVRVSFKLPEELIGGVNVAEVEALTEGPLHVICLTFT